MIGEDWRADLDTFFNPRSIAVVGATDNPASYVFVAFDYLRRYGYDGRIYPVNPRRETVWGLPSFKSVSDIDGPVDQAIIAVEARLVPEVLEECGKRGIANAVIFSAGFSEVGDEAGVLLQQRIAGIAEQYRLRVGGPNCTGFASLKSNTVCYSAPLPSDVPRGHVGLVSQSGMLSANMVYMGVNSGIGFAYVVSSGNEAVIEFSDYIHFMLQDPEVKVVAGFLEGIRDPRKFMAVARLAADMEKPFLVMKVGKSERGRRTAASHTGSLAGTYAVHQAAFKQTGVILTESFEQLVETMKLFSYRKPTRKGGLAIIGGSGGVCGYLADRAEEVGLPISDFSPGTQARLMGLLPSFGTVNNPLDMTGQTRTEIDIVANVCEAISEDDQVDVILFGIGITASVVTDFIKPLFLKYVDVAKRHPEKLIGFVSCDTETFTPAILEFVQAHQVPLLQGGRVGLKALKDLLDYNQFLSDRKRTITGSLPPVPPGVKEKWQTFFRLRKGPMLEGQAKALLSDYGIRVSRNATVSSLTDAKEAASSIGYPVVLKIQSSKILHKTEAGGVKLNLVNEGQLEAAFRDLEKLAREHGSGEGFLLEEMARPGVEMILGMKGDRLFGPVIVLGAGGIFTELYKDVALRLLPLDYHDAEGLVQEVRASALLHGFRGCTEGDLEALVEAILRMAELSRDVSPFISQIDVNPLVVFEKGGGVMALDALFLPVGADEC